MNVKVSPSVKQRACYQQIGDILSVEPTTLNAILGTINTMGIEAIIKQNASLGPYPEFSPAVYDIASEVGSPIEAPQHSDKDDEDEDEDRRKPKSKPKSAVFDEGEEATGSPPPYALHQGTAIIPVSGPLSKHPSSLGHMFGGSSTAGMRKALALALDDSRVERVLFHIDSPGGAVAGTGDLGDDIFRARSEKPIASYIEDLGASAAYWIASQTSTVFASPHAEVGSIGVLHVIQDMSAVAEGMGVKVHVVKAGKHKGRGVPGTEITDEDLSFFQGRVDEIYDSFVEVVARGRGISERAARNLADANIHRAPTAKELNLIDRVISFQEALATFSEEKAGTPLNKPPSLAHNRNMSTSTDSTGTADARTTGYGTGPIDVSETLKPMVGRSDERLDALTSKLDEFTGKVSKVLDTVVSSVDEIHGQVEENSKAINSLTEAREQEQKSRIETMRQEAADAMGKEPEDLAAFTSEDQLKVLIESAPTRRAQSLRGAPQKKDADTETQEKLASIRDELFGPDARKAYFSQLKNHNESPLRHGGRN